MSVWYFSRVDSNGRTSNVFQSSRFSQNAAVWIINAAFGTFAQPAIMNNVRFDLFPRTLNRIHKDFPVRTNTHTHTHTKESEVLLQTSFSITLFLFLVSYSFLFFYDAKSKRPKEVSRELWSRRLYVKAVRLTIYLTSLRVLRFHAMYVSWASSGTKRHVNFPRRSLPFCSARSCKWTSWERCLAITHAWILHETAYSDKSMFAATVLSHDNVLSRAIGRLLIDGIN